LYKEGHGKTLFFTGVGRKKHQYKYVPHAEQSSFARSVPVPFRLTFYQRTGWMDWSSKNYIKDEYEKYFYYIFRCQFSWCIFPEWLVSLDRE
jgi:hypothetical protein